MVIMVRTILFWQEKRGEENNCAFLIVYLLRARCLSSVHALLAIIFTNETSSISKVKEYIDFGRGLEFDCSINDKQGGKDKNLRDKLWDTKCEESIPKLNIGGDNYYNKQANGKASNPESQWKDLPENAKINNHCMYCGFTCAY